MPIPQQSGGVRFKVDNPPKVKGKRAAFGAFRHPRPRGDCPKLMPCCMIMGVQVCSMSSDPEKTAATTPEPVCGVRAASAWDAHVSEDFKRVLRSTVSKETYRAARGPPELDRSNRTFTSVQMCLALVHIAGLLGVASLYPQQITCLLTLFTGRHVFCIMQTGFGKTFAYGPAL